MCSWEGRGGGHEKERNTNLIMRGHMGKAMIFTTVTKFNSMKIDVFNHVYSDFVLS